MLAQRYARRQRRVGVITSGFAGRAVGVGSIDLGVQHLGEDVRFNLGCEGDVRLADALLGVVGIVSMLVSTVSVASRRRR